MRKSTQNMLVIKHTTPSHHHTTFSYAALSIIPVMFTVFEFFCN